jgi:hypothetical protein
VPFAQEVSSIFDESGHLAITAINVATADQAGHGDLVIGAFTPGG